MTLLVVWGVPILSILVGLLWPVLQQDTRLGTFVRGLLIYGIPAIIFGGALLLPAIQTGGEHPKAQCRRCLKQISLALQDYHDAHGSFPPAYILGPDGKRWHSWRTLILPYMDQQMLYKQYRFDEPWDGENNRKLSSQFPYPICQCRQDPSSNRRRDLTHFVAVVGSQTAWPGEKGIKLQDIKDGTANTVMVAEVHTPVPWFAPVDLSFEDATLLWGEGLIPSSHHPKGRHVLMADGTVRWLCSEGEFKLAKEVWEAMLTRHGKETVKVP
ncbi:MAG: DUF1559 domain-containing protein [Planctomycetaceae bacterium]